MNKFKKLGFIEYNGSLKSIILPDCPRARLTSATVRGNPDGLNRGGYAAYAD
jgi:hypothetical protein